MNQAQENNQLLIFSSNKQRCFYELYRRVQNQESLRKLRKGIDIEVMKQVKNNFTSKFPGEQQICKTRRSVKSCEYYLSDECYYSEKVRIKTGQKWLAIFGMSISVIGIVGSLYCVWRLVVPFLVKNLLADNKENVNTVKQTQSHGLLETFWKVIQLIGFGFGFVSSIAGIITFQSIKFFKFCYKNFAQRRKRLQQIEQQYYQRVRNQFINRNN